jgi:threonine dehydratase
MSPQATKSVTLADVRGAMSRIGPDVIRTPLVPSDKPRRNGKAVAVMSGGNVTPQQIEQHRQACGD